jgi:tripartite-type tricarboxylate transporter receptor subunit TctC
MSLRELGPWLRNVFWVLQWLALTASGGAMAQAWPARPITLVAPYAAGSGIDILARLMSPRLAQRLGQPVIVENKTGAAGNIGADFVAKSPANGHTLMLTSNAMSFSPGLYKKLPFDPVADFTHIAMVATGSMALVANPAAMPVKTLDALVSAARARPGTINYSSPGNGTPHHLAMELLKQQLGLDIVHIPYKGATGALNDLIGGQVQLAIFPVNVVLQHAKAGKLDVIAVSGKGRSVLAPQSPSFEELGLRNLDMDVYFFISGPANLNREIVERLNQEIGAMVNGADLRDNLLAQGLVPARGTSEEVSGRIAGDVARWKKFIAEKNITAD